MKISWYLLWGLPRSSMNCMVIWPQAQVMGQRPSHSPDILVLEKEIMPFEPLDRFSSFQRLNAFNLSQKSNCCDRLLLYLLYTTIFTAKCSSRATKLQGQHWWSILPVGHIHSSNPPPPSPFLIGGGGWQFCG